MIVTVDLLRHLAVQQVLKGMPTPRPFTVLLKGIAGPMTLYRLTLPGQPAACDEIPVG